MRAFSRKRSQHSEAIDQLRDWTRAHFKLSDTATIMVSEIACALPGCAPIETIVVFWPDEGRRHHFKVFKPVADVTLDDFPPWWMRNALSDIEGFGCACC